MKDISDIQTAMHCLHQLLGVLYEVANELGCEAGDTGAVRLSSLLILARDAAERIDGAVGDIIASEETLVVSEAREGASLRYLQGLCALRLRGQSRVASPAFHGPQMSASARWH